MYELKPIFCHSIQQAQSDRTVQSTRIQILPILIDSYVKLFSYLIATLGWVHEKFDVSTKPY